MTRLKRRVVGIQWINGAIEEGGPKHYACWGVYLATEDGEIEGRHPWEITTLMTPEEQTKELPNCSCNVDKVTWIMHSYDQIIVENLENADGLMIPMTKKMYFVECWNCKKRTRAHDMFDLVRTQWIKIAGY